MKKASKAKPAPKSKKGDDIIMLILADHKPLKKLIKILKDSDEEISERKSAFEEFAPLLVRHAKPEEQVLYTYMKENEELREEGFEGDVEHSLAEQMLDEAKRTDDEDLWSARVKVLAELVEHHIEEEEEDLLPDFKKNSTAEERIDMGQTYLKAKADTLEDGNQRQAKPAREKQVLRPQA